MNTRLKVAFLIFTLLLIVLPAVAQDDGITPLDDLLFAITGPVSFADGEILVGGVVIAPANAFRPSQLQEGDIVTVTGYLLNDNTIQAVSLEYPEDTVEPEITPEPEMTQEPEITPEPEVTPEPELTPEPGGETTVCGNPNHPVVAAIAEEFGVTYNQVMAMHCAGNGLGNITRAFIMARASNGNAQDFLDEHKNGKGWGQIIDESDVSPSELAPGQAVGKDKNKNKTSDDDTDTTVTTNSAPGNSGNTGKPDKPDKPDNSGNNGNNNSNNGNNGNNGGGNGKPKK